MRFRVVVVSIMIMSYTLGATAQVVESDSQAVLIQQLLERVQILEDRLAKMEQSAVSEIEIDLLASNADVVVASGRADPGSREIPFNLPSLEVLPESESPQDLSDLPLEVQLQIAEQTQINYPDLNFGGFGAVNFSSSDDPASNAGFGIGQVVLHVTSQLSPKIAYFGEFEMSGLFSRGGFSMERSVLRYDHNDYLKVSFGRYHTPINYWNTAYHHGDWLQTSIDRPNMATFGTQMIPSHFIGALVEGTVPASGLNLTYNAGLGNGRGASISRLSDFRDNNNNRALLGNFFVRPDALFGLQVGGSVYRDKVTPSGGREFREWISSAHVVWSRENPEFIAEFANTNHQELDGSGGVNTQAAYVHMAYRFNRLKPYYRFDYVDRATNEPFFTFLPSVTGSTAGVRWDYSTFAAFKFELRHQRRRGQPTVNGLFMQTSFAF